MGFKLLNQIKRNFKNLFSLVSEKSENIKMPQVFKKEKKRNVNCFYSALYAVQKGVSDLSDRL